MTKKFKINKLSRLVAVTLLAQASVYSAATYAQDVKLEKTEITGSSVKRINVEGALPVQTYSRQDIERTGAKSVADLIQNLTSMQGFTQSSTSVGGGGGGFSGASIHAVGETRTLVLVNGRRLAIWAGQELTGSGAGVDLNSLPISIIERVEILTDGASALYGADAVAGVINFITRTNSQEGNVSIDYSQPKGDVGRNLNLSITKGFGDLDEDGWNVLLSLNQEKQDNIYAKDREFSKTGIIDFDYNGESVNFFNGSSRSAPANYRYTKIGGGTVAGNPYIDKNGVCPANHVKLGTRCIYDYASSVEILPGSERTNGMLSASKKFGDHILNLNYLYSKSSLTYRIAAPPVDMAISPGTKIHSDFLALHPGMDPTKNLIATWRGLDAGKRTSEDVTETNHFSLSLKGKIESWDYNTAFTHSENEWIESHLAGWLKQNEQDAAVANATFNPFLEPGQQSDAGNAAIETMKHVGEFKRRKSTLDRLDLSMSREWKLDNWTNPIGTGFGLNFDREGVKYSPSEIARGIVNNIAGDSSQEVAYDVSRTSWGLFGELNLPFSKEFEWTNAARFDNYSDFGNNFTYKSSFRYQPMRELLIRGSLGSGFKAPSVPQIKAGRQLFGVTGAQYGCPTAVLKSLQATDATIVCPNGGEAIQYNQLAGGNPDLNPEKSFQFTLGFRAEPVNWFSFGADYWSVNVKDRINQLDEETVFGDPVTYAKNLVAYDDPGTKERVVAIFTPNENLGEEKFAGVDVDAKMQHDLGFGKLQTSLAWTHMLKHDYQTIKGGQFYSNLGKYKDGEVIFEDIIKLTFNLKHSNSWSHTLAWNFKSSYTDQSYTADDCFVSSNVTGDCVDISRTVKAYQTFDWQTQYTGLYKGLTLTAGLINLFDKDPPLSIKSTGGHQLGYDNRYTDAKGRTLYLKANYKF